MHIDPRLNEIDDCLYRVATKAIIIRDRKVLMVQEIPEMWWGFPGGGVDHGETAAVSLTREIEEELGVPAREVSSDFKLIHYTIGGIVDGVPRMNLFYKVSLPKDKLQKTDQIASLKWFTKNEFMKLRISPSYDKTALAGIIFDSQPA